MNQALLEPPLSPIKTTQVVNSYNEWDLLEEVIVGVVEGATVPHYDAAVKATVPPNQKAFFQKFAGQPFPQELIKAASEELETFVSILESEGVVVRRPDPIDHTTPFSTPDWSSCGLYQAMPRDLVLVIGNELIECPLAWRSRYFEINAYRKLFKQYFHQGAKWISAPRPQLLDSFYDETYTETTDDDLRFVINESEPTFDAADFIRCGKDLFVQKSNVTNDFGIEWLRRHLGKDYKIHVLRFDDSHPMHIDATFMPLAPGHLLVNPERVHTIPDLFKSWNIMYAPPSTLPSSHPMYVSSSWVSMNIFMLDEKRVIVEEQEKPTIELLKRNGFQPIPCPFRHFYSFGGGIHCATLDIKRNGILQSYF